LISFQHPHLLFIYNNRVIDNKIECLKIYYRGNPEKFLPVKWAVKSPPQRNFHIFPGEKLQNVKKRFELLNTGTSEGRF